MVTLSSLLLGRLDVNEDCFRLFVERCKGDHITGICCLTVLPDVKRLMRGLVGKKQSIEFTLGPTSDSLNKGYPA